MRRTIRSCLNSVVSQGEAEIIVVDGHSTDGTSQIIDEFHVHHLYDFGLGPSVARNIGVKNAKGEYLVIVDGDQVLDEDFQREISQIICTQKPDVVIHNGVSLSTGFWSSCYQFERIASIRINEALGLKAITEDIRVFKRSIINEIGGWDSGLSSFEDADLWHRLNAKSNNLKVSAARKAVIYSDELDVSPMVELKRGIFYGHGLIGYIRKCRSFKRFVLLPPYDYVYSMIVFLASLYKTRNLKKSCGVALLRCIRSLGYLWGSIVNRQFYR